MWDNHLRDVGWCLPFRGSRRSKKNEMKFRKYWVFGTRFQTVFIISLQYRDLLKQISMVCGTGHHVPCHLNSCRVVPPESIRISRIWYCLTRDLLPHSSISTCILVFRATHGNLTSLLEADKSMEKAGMRPQAG